MRRSRIAYSDEELAWLEANRGMIISDYHAGFQAVFGRPDVTATHLHSLRKRKGWKVGRNPGRYVGRSRLFSRAELQWLEENVTLETSRYHELFVKTFGRTDITIEQLIAARKNRKWRTGRTGRFEKGAVSHNKGKPFPTAATHPNCRKGQFKKGQEPHNTKHLGHERINKDGYVEISVAETNPHTGHERRYVHKHVHLWTLAHGPVPEGHVLKCLDGNKSNADPSNWEAVPRALLPRLNGGPRNRHVAYDPAPAELKPAVLAVAKLEHAARERRQK